MTNVNRDSGLGPHWPTGKDAAKTPAVQYKIKHFNPETKKDIRNEFSHVPQAKSEKQVHADFAAEMHVKTEKDKSRGAIARLFVKCVRSLGKLYVKMRGRTTAEGNLKVREQLKKKDEKKLYSDIMQNLEQIKGDPAKVAAIKERVPHDTRLTPQEKKAILAHIATLEKRPT